MLTEITCKKAACAPGKAHSRFADAGGLHLEVAASGSKRWFWKYRFDSKEKRLAIGTYPATKLKDARLARDDAKRLHSQGTDPTQHKKLTRAAARVNATTTWHVSCVTSQHGLKDSVSIA